MEAIDGSFSRVRRSDLNGDRAELAELAEMGLHYTENRSAGFHRRVAGRGFSYADEDGRPVQQGGLGERPSHDGMIEIEPEYSGATLNMEPNRAQMRLHRLWRLASAVGGLKPAKKAGQGLRSDFSNQGLLSGVSLPLRAAIRAGAIAPDMPPAGA